MTSTTWGCVSVPTPTPFSIPWPESPTRKPAGGAPAKRGPSCRCWPISAERPGFRLGDGDLALHVERTRRLAGGEPLSRIAEDMARRFGVHARIVPACDAAVRTVVRTPDGRLPFQHYFVRDRCEPIVTGFDFEGAETAHPCDAVLEALADRSLRCVVVCPSNPLISIDPILAVPGMRDAIRAAAAPVIGVSPIIGGSAVKGPTAKMMRELGLDVSNRSIERHYEGVADAWIIDSEDAEDAAGFDGPVRAVPTLMRTDADKDALAASGC